jgi:hypothetical protein
VTPLAHLTSKFSMSVGIRADRQKRFEEIRAKVPGWSNVGHLVFFDAVMANPAIKDVLVCGVYHGLDLLLLEEAARHAGRTDVKLTGVDLFSGKPCADWPLEKCGMTWQQAGFGEPPTLEQAWKNAPFAHIVQQDAARCMSQSPGEFDFAYLDTAHDEHTVRSEIRQARLAVRRSGMVAGDDYTGPDPSWGVEKVVTEMLPHHGVMFERIWFANL